MLFKNKSEENTIEENTIELSIRFKGEEEDTIFDVSLENANNLGIYGLNKTDDLKKMLKTDLIKAIKEKELYEIIIIESSYDEDDEEIFEEKTLVLDAGSIVFFTL